MCAQTHDTKLKPKFNLEGIELDDDLFRAKDIHMNENDINNLNFVWFSKFVST
jgi:hypothetical protein